MTKHKTPNRKQNTQNIKHKTEMRKNKKENSKK